MTAAVPSRRSFSVGGKVFPYRGDTVAPAALQPIEEFPSDDVAPVSAQLLLDEGLEFVRVVKELGGADRRDLPPRVVSAIDSMDSVVREMLDPDLPTVRWKCLVIINAATPIAGALRPHVNESVLQAYPERS